MPGFAERLAVFDRMTPEEWIDAAGEKAARGRQAALRAPDVSANVKEAIPFLDIVTKTIPGTPAERELQRKQLIWQCFAHGPAVAFCTPNIDTTANPVLSAVALGPGDRA